MAAMLGLLVSVATVATGDETAGRATGDAGDRAAAGWRIAEAAHAAAGEPNVADSPDSTQVVIEYPGGRYVIERSRNGEACVIGMQGVVNRLASQRFDEGLAKATAMGCRKPSLLLESPGGSLFDGLTLAKQVRAEGLTTVTRYECASACSLIFLGGTERVLVGSRAKIGFHEPSVQRGPQPQSSCSDYGMREIRSFVKWAVPETADRINEIIARTSCREVSWIGGQRAMELGVATRLEAEGLDVFGPKTKRVDVK